MKLIFERSVPGRRCSILPACDVEETPLPESLRRAEAPVLPELSEQDLSRHYTELNHHVHGVNCGFYPLGSCTMKYNPLLASHSNSRALCGCTRNLTDDQLRALAQTGGTVGLNLYPPFLGGRADFDTLRAHLEHMLTLCGEDHVALGGDLDGCDELARGFTDVSSWASFYAYLQAAGYPADLLDRIFFRNLLQLLQ